MSIVFIFLDYLDLKANSSLENLLALLFLSLTFAQIFLVIALCIQPRAQFNSRQKLQFLAEFCSSSNSKNFNSTIICITIDKKYDLTPF